MCALPCTRFSLLVSHSFGPHGTRVYIAMGAQGFVQKRQHTSEEAAVMPYECHLNMAAEHPVIRSVGNAPASRRKSSADATLAAAARDAHVEAPQGARRRSTAGDTSDDAGEDRGLSLRGAWTRDV